MRYGIFGDIHGNREAFEKVVEAYKREDIDRYICVGDIVGYGADPHWCIDEVQKITGQIVGGNHDLASAGTFNTDYFNYAARVAVDWTRENLDENEISFLRSLELVVKGEDFIAVHGSLDKPDFFYYIMDTASALKCFSKMECNICFVGHTHVPVTFVLKDGRIRYTFNDSLELEQDVRYIVNVGSIGQPRDGNPKAAYCIYDSDKRSVEVKRIDYDIETAKSKILKSGLPEILGYRLLEGR